MSTLEKLLSKETCRSISKRVFTRRTLKSIFKHKVAVAIAIMLIVMAIFGGHTRFFSFANFIDLARQTSHLWILGFGVTFAIICKGVDLSVGSVMTLSGILAVQMVNAGISVPLAMLFATLSGSLIGFINGFLIVQQKTEAFIITLGMGMLIKGVALLISNATPVMARDEGLLFMRVASSSTLGVPNIIWFMLIAGGIAFYLLRFTSFGRNCYALGGDYEVAEHSGINVLRTKWIAFVLSGTYAAFAGVLFASSVNSGSPMFGDEIPLLINCSVVIGGTSFAGGVGGIIHSFFGVLAIQLLNNCMLQLQIDFFTRNLILGLLIVSIVVLDCYAIKRKKEDV